MNWFCIWGLKEGLVAVKGFTFVDDEQEEQICESTIVVVVVV